MNLEPQQLLQREYLEMRSLALRLGAALDRLERGGVDLSAHPQSQGLLQCLAILQDGQPDRAARIQLALSRPYDPSWLTRRSG